MKQREGVQHVGGGQVKAWCTYLGGVDCGVEGREAGRPAGQAEPRAADVGHSTRQPRHPHLCRTREAK